LILTVIVSPASTVHVPLAVNVPVVAQVPIGFDADAICPAPMTATAVRVEPITALPTLCLNRLLIPSLSYVRFVRAINNL
jgi:hypothetical protein